jgi:tetratricopeptide (TPR) repeat protein
MIDSLCLRRARRRFAAALFALSGFALLFAALFAVSGHPGPARTDTLVYAAETPVPPLDHPDAVCASCHKEIYDHYEQTQMARGSGLATDGLIPGSYHHPASGVDYKVFLRDGAAWMSYNRSASDPRGPLSGEQRLDYYIGSATEGRTYLYQQNGQWFELPINYYRGRNGWEMAPALSDATHMPAPLPADPNCLHCHVTNVQLTEPSARNRYAGVPFRQGGIGCSDCHGDPTAHLAQKGHGPIANPAKFAPLERDSACIQCHLEGDAVVYRPGRSLAQFAPGDKLPDIAVYFVKASQQEGGNRAVSQYEALLLSACKRGAGDKLTCTTCHDPHFQPSADERVPYFRTRCLSCHTSPNMATHHTEQPNCATCHMPARVTVDISHAQVTDHDIEARPRNHAAEPFVEIPGKEDLVAVGNFPAGDRAYGLANAQLAEHGLPQAAETALRLLTKAAQSGQTDHEVEARLGYLLQISGDQQKASTAYSLALGTDPYDPTALANLAVIDASTGHVREAVSLLDRLTRADPSQTSAGLNLAFIECRLNQTQQALSLLDRLSYINPDDPQLRDFLHHGNYAGQQCDLHAELQPPTSSVNDQ